MAKRNNQTKVHKIHVRLTFSVLRVVVCLVLLAGVVGAYFVVPRIFHWNDVQDDFETNAINFHTVDIGQGDCTIVQFPDHKVLMVDTGEKSNENLNTIVEYLRNLHITTIDWFVISHPDSDHYGNAPALLAMENLTFKQKFCENSVYEKTTKTYVNMITEYEFIEPQDQQVIDTGAGYKITFVSPHADDTSVKTSNDSSLMMTIEFANKIFVLTGDASTTVEPLFINYATELGIFANKAHKQIILKVGHHGSSTSSGNDFLSFVFAEDKSNNFALISCGKDNSYGHPHDAALQRLGQYCDESNILITKDVGNIVVKAGQETLTINGKDYRVSYTSIFITIGAVIIVVCFIDFRPHKRSK